MVGLIEITVLALVIVILLLLRRNKRQQETMEQKFVEGERQWHLQNARLEETVRHLRANNPMGQPGMSDAGVAVEAIHNLAQKLHGVHLAANLAEEQVEAMRTAFLHKVVGLLRENQGDLGPFFAEGGKGQMVIKALDELAVRMSGQKTAALEELKILHEKVFRLNELLAAQTRVTLEGERIEAFELKKVVKDVLSVHAATLEELGVEVQTELENVPPILGFRGLLIQVLHHLVQNAREALMLGERSGYRKLQVRLISKDEERIRIEIKDNGTGISRENLTRIFTKGFTTKENAKGIGLHFCADNITRMGCLIGVKSQGLGFGATFVLEIPQQPSKMEIDAHQLSQTMAG